MPALGYRKYSPPACNGLPHCRRQVLFNFVSRFSLAPPGPHRRRGATTNATPPASYCGHLQFFLAPALFPRDFSAVLSAGPSGAQSSAASSSAVFSLAALSTAALRRILRGRRRRLSGHTAWLPEASGSSLRRFCYRRGLHDVLATLHRRDQQTMASSPTSPASNWVFFTAAASALTGSPWPPLNSVACWLWRLPRFFQGHFFIAFNINVIQSTFSAVALPRNSTLFNA